MVRGASHAVRATAIEELHALLKADLADATPLRYQSASPVHWAVARLASAVTASTGEAPFQHPSRRRVDTRAVERFRAEIRRFAVADNRVGGGHDREALISHMIANAKRPPGGWGGAADAGDLALGHGGVVGALPGDCPPPLPDRSLPDL